MPRPRNTRKLPRRLLGALLGASILGLTGCASDESTPGPSALPDTLPPAIPSQLSIERFGAVRYQLTTDWFGATPAVDGPGYTFVTDLGYRVHLEHAEASLGDVELVPCDTAANWPRRLWRTLSPIRIAHAAHSAVPDATNARLDVIDDLMAQPTHTAGPTPATGVAYCQAHILFVPLADAEGLGVSGGIRGTFTPPDGGEPQRLSGRINLRNGGSVVLEGAPDEIIPGATVEMVRYPAYALDGLQLERLTSLELGFEFLSGLAKTTRTRVQPD